MKTRSYTILLAVTMLVIVLCSTSGSAAKPLPASNQTTDLSIKIGANCTECLLTSNSDLVFTQMASGNNAGVGGIGTVGYFENTQGTDGNITYSKTIALDTSGGTDNNLKTTRAITYDNGEDGIGSLASTEMVLLAADTSETTSGAGQSICTLDSGATSDGNTTTASSLIVTAGSDVDLHKGSVTSDSGASIVSSIPGDGMKLSYNVDVDGLGNQTANDTKAEGKATVFVTGLIVEGCSDGVNATSVVDYDESVTVDGLIEIAMNTGYS
jgi:hypothetical protein